MPFTGAIDFVGVGVGEGVGVGVFFTTCFLYPVGQIGFEPETVRTFLPLTQRIVEACA